MSAPAPKPPLLRRLLPILLAVFGCGAGVGVGIGVKMLLPAKVAAEPAPPHDEEEKPEDPLRKRLDLAARSGNFAAGLKHARELLHESHDHPDPGVQYLRAICLEGQEHHEEALELYAELGDAKQPTGLRAVAACGEVRCLITLHRDPSAALERVAGLAHTPNVRVEWHYLRARVGLADLNLKPGPFAPDVPRGCVLNCPPEQYAGWLPPPPLDARTPHPSAADDTPPRPAADLRAVLTADPPHPDQPAVRLAAANLLLRAGMRTDATREYDALRKSTPPAPVLAAALYNLGLMKLRTHDWALARQHLTDAADLSARTPAAAVAWWWVGRAELDRGDTDACRAAWERAEATADRDTSAALDLGKVFLMVMDGQTERAAKILHRMGGKVAEPVPQLCEAFASYFRYRDAPTDARQGLLAGAVKAAGYGDAFGPAGVWIFGSWLRHADRTAIYDTASDTARGEWAIRFALALGEQRWKDGNTTDAAARFAAVATADAGERGDRARVRLAEIAFARGEPAECVRLGRVVLRRDPDDRADVLRLVGRGYEKLGDARAAAECFAGRLPP